MKRIPKIYLAGSCSSQSIDNIKSMIKSCVIEKEVNFIDPKAIMPNRAAYGDVKESNDKAMGDSDLMVCIMISQTAGSAIEMFIYTQILRKPVILVSGTPEDRLTPRVRSLTSDICEIDAGVIVAKLNGWVNKWYESE